MVANKTGGKDSMVQNNNLYVSGLPKEIRGDASAVVFRRIFARFGKIVSFKLIDSQKFATNLIYVAYRHSS